MSTQTDSLPDAPDSATDRPESKRGIIQKHSRWIAPLIPILAGSILIIMNVISYPSLSILDEFTHIDSLIKAPSVIELGERVGQEALREEACRGIGKADNPRADCQKPGKLNPLQYPGDGINTTSEYTPLFYAVSKVIATPITWIPGIDSLVTAGRLAGVVWLGAGLLLAYRLGRQWKIDKWVMSTCLTLIATMPYIVGISAYVNPDQAGFLAGALMWTAVNHAERRGRARWWFLCGAAVFVTALKMTNWVIIFLAVLYFVLRWILEWWRSRTEPTESTDIAKDITPLPLRDVIKAVIAVAGTGLLTIGGWLLIGRLIASPNAPVAPMSTVYAIESFPFLPVIGNLGSNLVLLPEGVSAPGLASLPVALVAARIISILFCGGMISAAFFGKRSMRTRALSIATIILLFFASSIFAVMNYVVNHVFFTTHQRYLISVVPIVVLLTASCIREKLPQRLLMIVAGGIFISNFAAFFIFTYKPF